MATAPYSIIAGPATVYVQLNTGSAPASPSITDSDATITGAGWTNLGLTDGGVKVKHTQTVDQLMADQRTGPVKAIRSQEGLEISFPLANITLANYAITLNNAALTTATAPNRSTIKPYQGFDVTQFSMLVRGPSPYMNANLQYYVPVVVETDSPEVDFVKDSKAVLQCTWVAIEDPNAATSADRFGNIVAQTS